MPCNPMKRGTIFGCLLRRCVSMRPMARQVWRRIGSEPFQSYGEPGSTRAKQTSWFRAAKLLVNHLLSPVWEDAKGSRGRLVAVCESCAGPRGQVWFAAVNFVGDEAYHPLDFFSNKMRTRPYWYLAVVAATGGLLGLDMASGYLEELSNALPELVVCTNLQGFVLVGTMMFSESAGAAMVTMLAHMIVTKGFVVVITIPTAPFMPGAVYSNAYFMMYIFFVFFLK
ncbi:unnamed protein product, partial [Symbiodinium necroappetens]